MKRRPGLFLMTIFSQRKRENSEPEPEEPAWKSQAGLDGHERCAFFPECLDCRVKRTRKPIREVWGFDEATRHYDGLCGGPSMCWYCANPEHARFGAIDPDDSDYCAQQLLNEREEREAR